METVNESIYDHPRYYDLVFGTDCAAELKFLCEINNAFLKGKAKRLFEPACGTGRLMYGLAKRGFEIEGIDLNKQAVDFSNARFKRHGLNPTAWVADMADFKASRKWDMAFNTINSFRHLTTHSSAVSHLECMARQTRQGGLYLIGLHLTPTTAEPTETESWAARRGHLSVLTHMWTEERNPRKRLERFGIQFDVYTPTKMFRIEDELRMRSYTAKQFPKLLAEAGNWEVAGTYDFAYDIKRPIVVDSATEDVVYVLRKV
ncbi:MAG: SAM-dependent methyltransferase [Mariniblastus sp.]